MSVAIESVPIEVAPVVEIDIEGPAAYICLSHNAVSHTVVLRDDETLSTMDLDASGNLIGIEKLLGESRTRVVFARSALKQFRYVSAKRPNGET